MYFVGPLLGWIMWLVLRKSERAMWQAVEGFFDWFPNFISYSIATILVNDITFVIYILAAGIFGMIVDEVLR